jgi:phosphopantothenoylcysteine decarboxylase/phosphopantothenate--cysteine ligase
METENVVENSRKKLEKKGADLIAANSLREAGSGFAADTNHLILIEKDHLQDFPMMDKADAADALLTRLKECYLSEKKEVHDDLCD